MFIDNPYKKNLLHKCVIGLSYKAIKYNKTLSKLHIAHGTALNEFAKYNKKNVTQYQYSYSVLYVKLFYKSTVFVYHLSM